MIETTTAPAPPALSATALPASGPLPAADDRSVNLGRRFFNFRTGASFLLGIAILAALVRGTSIHPAQIWEELRQVDGRLYALAILTYSLTFVVRGFRWQVLLRNVGHSLPLVPLTEVIFLSWFVNSVVPAKLGDVYRGYLLRREYGLSMSRTIGTVVAERVVDVLALILLLGSTGYLVLSSHASPEITRTLQFGWIVFALLVVGLFASYRFGERIVAFFPARVQDIYAKFAHGTFTSFKNLPFLGALTVLAWSAEAGRLFFVVKSLHVASVGPLGALFTVAAISLALIAPTPGGLGAVETTFVLVLGVFGVSVPVALAVALLDRLISYYSLIVIGLPTFLLSKRGR